MAFVTAFSPSTAGTAPTYGAANASDTADLGERRFLVVKTGGTATNVTLVTPGTLPTGDAYPDKVYAIGTSAEAWIPLIQDYSNGGIVTFNFSATASVTRAVIQP